MRPGLRTLAAVLVAFAIGLGISSWPSETTAMGQDSSRFDDLIGTVYVGSEDLQVAGTDPLGGWMVDDQLGIALQQLRDGSGYLLAATREVGRHDSHAIWQVTGVHVLRSGSSSDYVLGMGCQFGRDGGNNPYWIGIAGEDARAVLSADGYHDLIVPDSMIQLNPDGSFAEPHVSGTGVADRPDAQFYCLLEGSGD